ncbi:DUF6527 family protein [Nitrobacter hamburgensis]|uniref:DUF6527 family protein n=1 Tax=Nitrobacter hamburgensis TaxID=912 RepID=UPI003D3217AE
MNGEAAGYAFRCPWVCGLESWLPIDDGLRGWTWDGSRERPTLRPSVLHRSCGWHGYLTNGVWEIC